MDLLKWKGGGREIGFERVSSRERTVGGCCSIKEGEK